MNVGPWSGSSQEILSIEVAQLAQPCSTKYSLRRSSQQIDGLYTQIVDSSWLHTGHRKLRIESLTVAVRGRYRPLIELKSMSKKRHPCPARDQDLPGAGICAEEVAHAS